MNDQSLIAQALQGDKRSLNVLLEEHQQFIFNVAMKMLDDAEDAKDATQEVLIKIMTNLGKYDDSKAKFTTWVYRITCNHIINFRKSYCEIQGATFENFFHFMESIPDTSIEDAELESMALDVEEAKITCTSGMLMCLDREQRLIYILGDIFRLDQQLAAEAMDLSPGNFRVKLLRARKDLHHWMHNKCGLVNQANPCRCRNKTKKLIEMGKVDPNNRKWLSEFQERISSKVDNSIGDFTKGKDEIYNRLYQEHPYKIDQNAKRVIQEVTGHQDFSKFMDL